MSEWCWPARLFNSHLTSSPIFSQGFSLFVVLIAALVCFFFGKYMS